MNKQFFADMAERALATFAQAAAAVVVLSGFDVTNTGDLANATKVGAVAALLSVLKSLAARGVGNQNDASLVK